MQVRTKSPRPRFSGKLNLNGFKSTTFIGFLLVLPVVSSPLPLPTRGSIGVHGETDLLGCLSIPSPTYDEPPPLPPLPPLQSTVSTLSTVPTVSSINRPYYTGSESDGWDSNATDPEDSSSVDEGWADDPTNDDGDDEDDVDADDLDNSNDPDDPVDPEDPEDPDSDYSNDSDDLEKIRGSKRTVKTIQDVFQSNNVDDSRFNAIGLNNNEAEEDLGANDPEMESETELETELENDGDYARQHPEPVSTSGSCSVHTSSTRPSPSIAAAAASNSTPSSIISSTSPASTTPTPTSTATPIPSTTSTSNEAAPNFLQVAFSRIMHGGSIYDIGQRPHNQDEADDDDEEREYRPSQGQEPVIEPGGDVEANEEDDTNDVVTGFDDS